MRACNEIINYEEKEMIPVTNEESIMKCKKFATYAKKFSTDKNDEHTFKLYHKIIVIILENLEELLIVFVI